MLFCLTTKPGQVLGTSTGPKGYLQILFGPGLILSCLHWLSVVFPPSFTLLSPQVPALIAAPTLQVSLLSHQVVLIPTHAVSLPLSLTPDPIPVLQSWQTSQDHHLEASGAPRMQQFPILAVNFPQQLFGGEAEN